MAGNRVPDYVPYAQRIELDKLSKNDLMEIAYSFALKQTGCEDWHEAYNLVIDEQVALALSDGRKPAKMKRDVPPLSLQQVTRSRAAKGVASEWELRLIQGWEADGEQA